MTSSAAVPSSSVGTSLSHPQIRPSSCPVSEPRDRLESVLAVPETPRPARRGPRDEAEENEARHDPHVPDTRARTPSIEDFLSANLTTLTPPTSSYWDASSMAPLNPTSAAAIACLRAYRPPAFATWDRLSVSRRAAILLLLYPDRRGELRVVITMRAASLRTFSGHAALPGGKADSLEESPYRIARREAHEEIGLPRDDALLPQPFRIEHLCDLPCHLAQTDVAVRPCVALLSASASDEAMATTTVDESLIPRLDAKEVAAVFTAPFHNFLCVQDEAAMPASERAEDESAPAPPSPLPLPPGEWYRGHWADWHGAPWRVHYFQVPVHDQRVTKPKGEPRARAHEVQDAAAVAAETGRYTVWGMTARVVVDAAKVAYAQEPEFEHNPHLGDEEVIERLERAGRLREKKARRSVSRRGSEGSRM